MIPCDAGTVQSGRTFNSYKYILSLSLCPKKDENHSRSVSSPDSTSISVLLLLLVIFLSLSLSYLFLDSVLLVLSLLNVSTDESGILTVDLLIVVALDVVWTTTAAMEEATMGLPRYDGKPGPGSLVLTMT